MENLRNRSKMKTTMKMKKILLTVALALTVISAGAQTAANRTPRTKVSDALALMPAPEGVEYNRLMEDLVSSGAEGLDMLTSMFDNTNNVPVVYALSGWAAYVTAPGREISRKAFAEGIVNALQRSQDPEIKAFYIRLLQQCGRSESVKALVDLIDDPRLGDPARCALEAITQSRSGFPMVYTNAPVTRIGKLYNLIQTKGAAALPQLAKAAQDADRNYRNTALRFAAPYADDEFYAGLIARLPKAKPEVKTDLITWLGLQGVQSALPAILPWIGNEDIELSAAAMWAATRLGGQEVNDRLIEVLSGASTPDTLRTVASECLLSSRTPVVDAVAQVVSDGSDAGKVAALSILAAKQARTKASLVLEQTSSRNADVAVAAYKALKDVVSPSELEALYVLLESVSEENLPMVQDAVIAALSEWPAAERLEAIKSQMTRSEDKAARYYVVLAATGESEALKMIAQGYAQGNEAEKDQAVNALLAWQGIESAEYLYEVAKGGDAAHFDKVLSGYVDRVKQSNETPELKQIMLSEMLELARTSEQKKSILGAMGATRTFQALVTLEDYLEDPDQSVRQWAADQIYSVVSARTDLYGPAIREIAEKAIKANEGRLDDYGRSAVLDRLKAMPQEGGFVSMFNGKDLTGWKGLVENPIKRAAMTPQELAEKQKAADEIMRRDWEVIDGLLTFTGKGYDNICTEKQYGDFEMYVDWLLYPDSKEADAGIYLRGTPQVQMWDTARRNVGAQVGSGGLYNNQINPSKPSHVADNKLGHWNTFYIKMVGDRVTVILNGEKVVDNVMLENYWDRSLPIPAVEQIELQAHGTRVAYRNLYINELERPEPFKLSAEEEAEGFRILFDGQNMHEWIGNTQDYVMEDGTITLYPANGHGGNLYTKDEFDNFVFRFEFKLTPGANNGLGIRTPTEGDAAYVGMELQILDNDAPIYSQLEPYQYHGSVYGVIPAKRGALKPVGEWNYQEVVADGNHIKVTLNGQVIVDGDIAKASDNGKATMDHKEHPGLLNPSGHIGFLGHGSEVSFRNIRIKELK